MNKDIKEILDYFRKYMTIDDCIRLNKVEDYITNLQEELEYVRKQNNDLRKIYRNTYKRYQEQGNDEMAGYFMAQIDECRTFYVEPVVDYYMLSKQLQEIIDKALDKLYCYGEVFDSKILQQFQKEMENILGDENEKDI